MHRTYKLNQLLPPSEDGMAEIARILEGFGLKVKIGG
jgi:hypothetical protein